MWMMPLHLHVNQKSDYDYMMMTMRPIVDQSLAAGFIPMNTRQQRASLQFKPSVPERKVYNNEDIAFFSVLTFATCVIMR